MNAEPPTARFQVERLSRRPGYRERYPAQNFRLACLNMIHDADALATSLGANLELENGSDPDHNREIYRFSDNRLKYELWITPSQETAILAIDPTEPIQGCPMLEFSFKCSDVEIGTSAYSENEVAIRFYDGGISNSMMRLTMTWIPSGYWYIWANANSTPYG